MKKDITSNRSKHWLEWNDYNQPKVKNYLLSLKDKYNFTEFYFSDLIVIINDGVKYRKRSIITHQGQKKKHLGQEVQKIR